MSRPLFGVRYLDRVTAGFTVLILFVGGFIAGTSMYSRHNSHALGLFPTAHSVPGNINVSLWPFTNPPQDTLDTDVAENPFAWSNRKVTTVEVSDTADLKQAFDRLGYRLDSSSAGAIAVPRVVVSTLPPDLPDLNDVDLRKSLFFRVMLPLILQVNELILDQRERLIGIRDRVKAGEALSNEDRDWLTRLESYYGVESDDYDALLKRVDAVPPSLALAQAAIESGWGTSRFAVEGNALFGQYTTDETNGLTPISLDESDDDIRIRAFGGLFEAVLSYMHNLNTHLAYSSFRSLRADQRKSGDSLDGDDLAGGLTRYSLRGDDYVRDVRRTIHANHLDDYDGAWLLDSKITHLVFDDS